MQPARVAYYRAALEEYSALPGMAHYAHFRTSEDCLYLNVWSTNVGGAHARPVILWIHGGGNIDGTGALPILGPTFARRGVVFVSINYRLGALGLAALPALTAESIHHTSGNYAFLDQIAAIAWVKRNIGMFGGDPHSITLMGESAGGADVCDLMASPLARNLFQRAIIQSNGCANYRIPELSRSAEYNGGSGTGYDAGLGLARRLGVNDGPNELARLRARSVEQVLAASDTDGFGETVDGYVFREQAAAVFAAGRQSPIPLLIGSNADESSMFADDEAIHTVASYQASLKKEFHQYWTNIWESYPAQSDSEVPSVWRRMFTDYLFGSSTYMLASAMRRAGAPAHVYYFTYPAKGRNAPFGAHHGAELSFLTGIFRRSYWGAPDARDQQLSARMGGYWARFASTGDPNGTGLVEWPMYDSGSHRVLELGTQVRVIEMPRLHKYEVFEQVLTKQLATHGEGAP